MLSRQNISSHHTVYDTLSISYTKYEYYYIYYFFLSSGSDYIVSFYIIRYRTTQQTITSVIAPLHVSLPTSQRPLTGWSMAAQYHPIHRTSWHEGSQCPKEGLEEEGWVGHIQSAQQLWVVVPQEHREVPQERHRQAVGVGAARQVPHHAGLQDDPMGLGVVGGLTLCSKLSPLCLLR